MTAWIDALREIVPAERLSTRRGDLEQAGRDESSLPPVPPEAVAWPLSADEVERIVRLARSRRFAVTARGGGTSLEGNPIPVERGLVLDFSRMNRVLDLRPRDLTVSVEPGIVYDDLNHALRDHGLFFPPSPGGSAESATIGGMVANDASGIYALRYGATRDAVLGATVVLGTGETVRLGGASRKSSSGYHLLGLVVGSEGTLGLVTEVTLRLEGLPAERRRFAVAFPTDVAAAEATSRLVAYGVDLAAVEFVGAEVIGAVNRHRSLSLGETPTLLLEAHGSKTEVAETVRTALELASEVGGREIAGDDAWAMRHHATRSIVAEDPGAEIVRADVAFPISVLPEIVEETRRLARERGLRLYVFGHAGLGVLHVLVVARRSDESAWGAAVATKDDVVRFALERRGTASGEHGLGLANRRYARAEHGTAIDLMRAVKAVFDPEGILNPGKIWET